MRTPLFCLLWLLTCSSVFAGPVGTTSFPWSATCAATRGHHDGDTFACVTPDAPGGSFVVRFGAFDAPEVSQAHWRPSRELMRSLTTAGTKVDCYKQSFERFVCRVHTPDGRDVTDAMLSAGLAWPLPQFASEQAPQDRARYARLAEEARAAHRGLFADPQPQTPWDCRKAKAQHQRCR